MRIWKIEGRDLDVLRAELADYDQPSWPSLVDSDPVYSVRFADDGGGLKVKVNGGMWSLSIGDLEVDA